MAKQTKSKSRTEYGDFQTSEALAFEVTELLRREGIAPRAVLEPSCGRGAFLIAAAQSFPDAATVMGVDINPDHIVAAKQALTQHGLVGLHLEQSNFFTKDWGPVFRDNSGPWLVLGNPPWVTSSSLGVLESQNVPVKSNFHGRVGIEAVTGKSNFDISEWMLLKYFEWLRAGDTIAVLCKTSVARKVLLNAWKKQNAGIARIYKIDAMESFGAAVDACLFVVTVVSQTEDFTCQIFGSLSDTAPIQVLSFVNGHLVTKSPSWSGHESLWGPESNYVWRSGVKHDCSRVMELFPGEDHHVNGLGEAVSIESEFLYPMLKGSDIGNGRTTPRGSMIVTQRCVGEETSVIAEQAPKTWQYLHNHDSLLNKRGSIIYRNKPVFSIFGVGPYTFTPWKLAVSSFYKKLLFVPVGPVDGKTVVFDDTVYFLACSSEAEAQFLKSILHSEPALAFFESMVHWSDKRPLTIELLKRLSLAKLCAVLGREKEYEQFVLTRLPRPTRQLSFDPHSLSGVDAHVL